MDNKLLPIAAALVIFAVVIIPVTADLPAVNPLPGRNTWDTVWGLLVDLQNQIKNIQLMPGPQGEPGPMGPEGPQGEPGAILHFEPLELRELEPTDVPGIWEYSEIATTDGFVLCMVYSPEPEGNVRVIGTIGGVMTIDTFGHGVQSIVMPVAAGEEWKVIAGGTAEYEGSCILWRPLVP